MSFLTRWSRLKRDADTQAAPAKVEPVPPAELPPVDSLTFESDFAAFLRANVEESVKRAALKKLLHDPRFNVMDGLDTYIDDYTKNEGVSEEMLKTLEHARSTLFPPAAQPAPEPSETAASAEDAVPPPQVEADVDPRQDT
jgi:hypothetical protein